MMVMMAVMVAGIMTVTVLMAVMAAVVVKVMLVGGGEICMLIGAGVPDVLVDTDAVGQKKNTQPNRLPPPRRIPWAPGPSRCYPEN